MQWLEKRGVQNVDAVTQRTKAVLNVGPGEQKTPRSQLIDVWRDGRVVTIADGVVQVNFVAS